MENWAIDLFSIWWKILQWETPANSLCSPRFPRRTVWRSINKISPHENNTLQITALKITCAHITTLLLSIWIQPFIQKMYMVAFNFFVQWFVLNLELLQSAWDLLWPPHLQCEVMGKGHILWGNVRADGTRNWKKCNAGNSLDLWPWHTDWLD